MSENKNQKPLGKSDWWLSILDIIKRMTNFAVKGVINSVVGKIIGTLLIDFTFIAGAFYFIWLFYCGIADRLFNIPIGEGSETIINPSAFTDAITDGNLLIIFFPFTFLCFSLLLYYHLIESEKPEEDRNKTLIRFFKWSVVLIVLFDVVVATVSMFNLYNYHTSGARRPKEISQGYYFFHGVLLLFCGIFISFALGLLLYCVRKVINLKKFVRIPIDDTEEFEYNE